MIDTTLIIHMFGILEKFHIITTLAQFLGINIPGWLVVLEKLVLVALTLGLGWAILKTALRLLAFIFLCLYRKCRNAEREIRDRIEKMFKRIIKRIIKWLR